uniref:Exportin-T n=1 Tax=Hirondellea gigas TaxID=1518452 RepID=A0A6A7G2A3_9CRUS
MEQFERAILLSLDHKASVEDRGRVVAYLESLNHQESSWKLAIKVLESTQRSEVAFSAWNLLSHFVENHWDIVSDSNRSAIRNWVLEYVRKTVSDSSLPNNISNKISTLLVILCKLDYPERWSSFFVDLISLLQFGPQAFDTFFRVLNYFDEDLIAFDDRRSQKEVLQITKIKDYMRQSGTLVQLVEVWYKVLEQFHTTQPEIASMCLHTISHYLGWMNVSLVLNEQFVSLFLRYLSNPKLQIAAVKCIRAFIHRRISIEEHFELFKRFNILEVISKIDINNSNNEPLLIAISDLISAIGSTLIVCCQESSDNDKSEYSIWLSQTFSLSNSLGKHQNFRVSHEILDFLSKYVHFIFSLKKRENIDLLSIFREMFSVVFTTIRFPNSYNPFEIGEFEEEFDQHRIKANNLFKTLLESAENHTIALLNEYLSGLIAQIDQTHYSHVEVALHLISLIGTHLRISAIREDFKNRKSFYLTIELLMDSTILRCDHQSVSILYFNIVSKFGELFASHNRQSLGQILACFLDSRGVQHSNSIVRSKSCYYLLKLVEQLSSKMRNELSQFANQIIDCIHFVFMCYIKQKDVDYTSEDFLNVCQLIGCLTKRELIGNEKSHEVMSACIHPMQSQMSVMVEQKEFWTSNNAEFSGNRVADICNGIANLAKYLPKDADILFLFLQSLRTIIGILSLIPSHENLRSSTLVLIHHLLPNLGKQIFSTLPKVFDIYLNSVNSSNVTKVLQFIHRLISHFGNDIFELMDILLLKIISAIFSCFEEFSVSPPNGHIENGHILNGIDRIIPDSAVSQLKLGHLNLLRQYYLFISTISRSDLIRIFVSERNVPHLKEIFQSLVKGSSQTPDLSVNLVCFEIFRRIVRFWEHFDKVSGFYEAFTTFVVDSSFQSLQQKHINPDDAASNRLFREIAQLHIDMHQMFLKRGFIDFLSLRLCERVSFDSKQSQKYCQIAVNAETNTLKKILRDICRVYYDQSQKIEESQEQQQHSQSPNR